MDAPFLFVDEVETAGRICLVRLDLNVPLANGRVSDDTRIRRILPGLESLRQAGARIIILTHLGRPKGRVVQEFSVAPVAAHMAGLLGCPVPVESNLLGDGARDAVVVSYVQHTRAQACGRPAHCSRLVAARVRGP